ncbi:hypothetical protein [Paraburkholderia adhaesiva]|uniref:hypothetical protein n=1 Tax=Paraburkholderia adhaesiva TaxID=2883244 RepID=UPI001F1873F3|nr:hypothetical protein [Paraburkholderia adhaesiva]
MDALVGFETRWPGTMELMIDSGAFTAWTLGKKVTLDGYCRFIDSLPVKPVRYFTLDVIENAVETERNFNEMRSRGYDPMPIFTPGATFDYMDELYGLTDWIACGGVAGQYSNYGKTYLGRVMKHVGDRKIHLLGVTSMPVVKFYRPYSTDSSSWDAARIYGHAQIYVGHGQMKNVARKDFMRAPSHEFIRYVTRAGLDPKRLGREQDWHGKGSILEQITAFSWVTLQQDMLKRIGTRLYLGLNASRAVDALSHAWEAYLNATDQET